MTADQSSPVAWFATPEVLNRARHYCGQRILDHSTVRVDGICEEDAGYALSEWLNERLAEHDVIVRAAALTSRGEGWVHACPRVGSERWYPLGAPCASCGRKFGDEH